VYAERIISVGSVFFPVKRNESGQFAAAVTLDDVLDVFDEVDGPVVTTGDVADATGCSRDSARRKLDQLHEQGRVGRRRTAGRVLYWRLEAAEPNPVNPADPIFTDRPSFATGIDNLSERVDELLYGNGG